MEHNNADKGAGEMNSTFFILLAILIVAEVLVVRQFIKVGWPKRSNQSTVLKCTGSLIFIITAVVSTLFGGGFTPVAWIMLAGFCLSLVGDFWLDLEINDKHIFGGILFFFLAHVSYTYAFIQVCERDLGASSAFSKGEIIAVLVIFAIAGAGSFIVKMDMRKLFLPVAVYSLTICTMVIKSVVMCFKMLTEGKMDLPFLLVLSAGTLLFIISDIVLAFMYFRNAFTKKMRIINLTTYFTGQMFMAISLAELAN